MHRRKRDYNVNSFDKLIDNGSPNVSGNSEMIY